VNRKELADVVSERTGLSGSQAQQALDAVMEAIVATVAEGAKVVLPGFGTFEPRDRAARQGRNPQTGAPMEIAASRQPAFKPASQFKERVRG